MSVRYYPCDPSHILELKKVSQETAEGYGTSSKYLVMPSQNGRDLKGRYLVGENEMLLIITFDELCLTRITLFVFLMRVIYIEE